MATFTSPRSFKSSVLPTLAVLSLLSSLIPASFAVSLCPDGTLLDNSVEDSLACYIPCQSARCYLPTNGYALEGAATCNADGSCQFSCNLEGYAVIDGETTDSRCASISSLPLSFQSTKQKRSSGGLEPRRLQSTCDTGLTKCWVGVGKLGFDCLDISTNLEACGGCSESFGGDGMDCTSIDGVDEVRCADKQCLITSCLPGYSYYGDLNTCILSM